MKIRGIIWLCVRAYSLDFTASDLHMSGTAHGNFRMDDLNLMMMITQVHL